MLAEFIELHREELIARVRAKATSRTRPRATALELKYGVPLFLTQLQARLRSTEGGAAEIGEAATLHGSELLEDGFTIGQVVHGYGDVCQAVTELAVDLGATIATTDFRTLNLCLDVAIAEAVTEYARKREQKIHGESVEHLGFLAHEMRNLLATATLAFEAVRSGSVAISGSTGAVVERSLAGMNGLITRSLAEVRLASKSTRSERVVLCRILEEVEISATQMAVRRAIDLMIAPVAADVVVIGDAQIVASVVINLVQNALKFTKWQGRVSVTNRVSEDRVAIDVSDECGGLPPGKEEELFKPFSQRGTDRSGLGLGLAICVKGAASMGGTVSVRNIPGTGCVFTVDFPRAPLRA